MPSLTSVLDIARTALTASQDGIAVTSHNISNANTPGYSKETANFQALDPVNFGGLLFGTGVTVQGIQRSYDYFVEAQFLGSNADLNRFQSQSGLLKTLESNLNDFGGSGLSAPLNAFFNSFHDVANNPSGYAERSTAISNATLLAQKFNNVDSAIRQNFTDINSRIQAQVLQVNNIASQIASLNQKISGIELGGSMANDLRDQRGVLLKNLSNIIDVRSMENTNGQVDVYAGGVPVVVGVSVSQLTVSMNSANPDIFNVVSGNNTVLNDSMTGGSLKGLIDGGRYLQQVQGKLDLMAASLVKTVNVQHEAGYDLNNTTGNDFFKPLTVTAVAGGANTGAASVASATVSSTSALTLDNYQVRFSSSTAYVVVDKTTGAMVQGTYVPGLPNTIPGIPGVNLVISDTGSGPKAGDTFDVSLTKGAARNISVAITDPNQVAAAQTPNSPGDNRNALALSKLKDTAVIGSSTLGQHYGSIISDIGVQSSNAAANVRAQQVMTNQLQAARDSVSGVSMEEEAVSLIKYQKSYEAAAKVMTTANNLMDALFNIIR